MIKKIILILSILILGISSSFAASSSLNVVLANQNPDPVSPGNFVFVNLKVSNTGEKSIESSNVEFVENSYFKLAAGEEKSKSLGVIPAFSSTSTSTSYVIAKYKLYVDPKTPLGLNTIKFNIVSEGTYLNFEFDLLVQDANPTIQLISSNVENEYIKAGESQELNLEFTNKNNIDLRNVVITLDLDGVEDTVFSTKQGSNQVIIENIEAQETVKVNTQLIATPDAESKPYLLPITIEYEDTLGNSYEKEVISTIQVYSKPELSLEVDSQEIYSKGKGKISLAIANPTPTTAKGVELRVLDSQGYEIIEGDFQYVGDLNPDDFQTLQSEIYINSLDTKLKVELSYLDSYNREIVETKELDLKLYNEEKLKELGLSSSNQSSGFPLGTIIFIIIGIIIGFFIGKRSGKKTKK